MNLVYIAIGGAIGSVLRYVAQSLFQSTFPWGTMIVNWAGCLAIGLIWGLTERFEISPSVRLFVMVGVLGGFTTFSSFALESHNLLADGEWRYALGYILGSNVVGIVLVFAGVMAVRAMLNLLK